MSGSPRLVVCAVGGRADALELPWSDFDDGRQFISGGERSLYELATAGAVLGMDVELRGAISRPILDQLASSAGAAPKVGFGPRRPDPADVVVIPETADVGLMAAVHLSEARTVLFLLAGPGLFGWSFLPGWESPDAWTVPLESVGQPGTYRAADRLGFALWSNAHGIVEVGAQSGVPVCWLGTGTPVPFPPAGEKTFDVAVVGLNRWRDWAEEAAGRLTGASILRIPAVPSTYSLCEALAPARILVWPSRVEGMSRIAREARGVGTVPVALDTSPFANVEDHGGGIVLVPDLDRLVEEADRLLADPVRLDQLAIEARESARLQADWDSYVRRVEQAVAAVAVDPAAHARGRFGESLQAHYAAYQEAGDAQAADLRRQLEASHGEQRAQRDRLKSRLVDRSRIGRVWSEARSWLIRP